MCSALLHAVFANPFHFIDLGGFCTGSSIKSEQLKHPNAQRTSPESSPSLVFYNPPSRFAEKHIQGQNFMVENMQCQWEAAMLQMRFPAGCCDLM